MIKTIIQVIIQLCITFLFLNVNGQENKNFHAFYATQVGLTIGRASLGAGHSQQFYANYKHVSVSYKYARLIGRLLVSGKERLIEHQAYMVGFTQDYNNFSYNILVGYSINSGHYFYMPEHAFSYDDRYEYDFENTGFPIELNIYTKLIGPFGLIVGVKSNVNNRLYYVGGYGGIKIGF